MSAVQFFGQKCVARPVFPLCFSLKSIARPKKKTKKCRPSCPAPKFVARPFIREGVYILKIIPRLENGEKVAKRGVIKVNQPENGQFAVNNENNLLGNQNGGKLNTQTKKCL